MASEAVVVLFVFLVLVVVAVGVGVAVAVGVAGVAGAEQLGPGVLVALDLGRLLQSDLLGEEVDGGLAVDLEPVRADEVLLVEDGVVRTQKPEVLELKPEKKNI